MPVGLKWANGLMRVDTFPRAEQVSVAVLGTGSIGMRHLKILGQMDRVRPVAIPVRPERSRRLEADGVSCVKDWENALQQGITHAVIATDTGRHVEDGMAAVGCGLDVLIEKPLSMNAREARTLCARATQLNRRLFVGCVLRFSESLSQFRGWLKEIGRLHAVRIECRSYLPDWRPGRDYHDSYSSRADEGGVLRDLIHEVDYAGWIFGWPKTIQARLRNLGRLGIAAEEMADLMWESAEGATISIGLDYLTRPTRRQMIASGERGTLEWDGVAQTVRLAVAGSPIQELKSSQGRDGMFLAQARAFLQADGDADLDCRLATGEEGVRALAVCDAARRASANLREEQVEAL